MKRLLAYLFIVLGLGLVFSVNGNAKTYYCVNKALDENYMIPGGDYSLKSMLKKYNNNPSLVAEQFYQKYYKKKDLWNCGKKTDGFRLVSEEDYLINQKVLLFKLHELATPNKKVSKNNSVSNKGNTRIDLSFCKKKSDNYDILYPVLTEKFANQCIWENGIKITYQDYLKDPQSKKNICFNTRTKLVNSRNSTCPKDLGYSKVFYENGSFYYTSTETQIAKAEPDTSSADKSKIEKEKKKIAEEKRKIEEEKRKIAEAKKKQEEEEKKSKEANAKLYVIGSGTGFFVSSEGHAVSNDHVVGICRKVATKIDGKKIHFNILKTDKVNDIGLIKGDYKSPSFLSIKSDGAEYGEDIVAFGYPLTGILSSSVKLTRGIVSSLSGLNNNYSEIQIDAAIQPGNSGGPVLNMEGQVVGVASSGLNKLAMIEETAYIPENVNFAVAAPTLLNFLKANGVTAKNEVLKINNTKELAKVGRPATIQLFCLNTKAKHEELKRKKKHSDVLLEKVIELN